jgi:acyl-CoA reductase-like NAD-dependent aldehyde dehydrogenase
MRAQALHISHASTEKLIGDPELQFVSFTGSVEGGHQIVKAAKDRFIGVADLRN